MDQPAYTTSEFHSTLLKQMAGTIADALSYHKLAEPELAAILAAAHLLAADDIRLGGRFALHGLDQHGPDLTPSDEAYLSVTARDRDTNVPWLSLTYWLSDLALADRDPDRVRTVIAAMERSLDKVKAWLADQDAQGYTAPAPEAPAQPTVQPAPLEKPGE